MGWEENFNPKKSGWRDNTTDPGWDCTIDNTGRIQVTDNTPGYGHVYSPLLTLDINKYSVLTIDVASVDSGANFSLEIQDYYNYCPVTWKSYQTKPGIYTCVIPQTATCSTNSAYGYGANFKFYVSFWVGGGQGKGIKLNSIKITTQDSTDVTTYTYDPFNRRIKKDVKGSVTQYIYDNNQIIAEYDSSGTLLRKYVYNPQRIDEPVKGLSPQGTVPEWYYHFDGLGSVISLTNSSGAIIEEYEYSPFGETTILDPTTHSIRSESLYNNRFLFTARELDSESGLYYYRNRYYDSEIGRFISADPSGYVDGPNLYTYVRNNPVNYVDMFGDYSRKIGPFPNPKWYIARDKAKEKLEKEYGDKFTDEEIKRASEWLADEINDSDVAKLQDPDSAEEAFEDLAERIKDKLTEKEDRDLAERLENEIKESIEKSKSR